MYTKFWLPVKLKSESSKYWAVTEVAADFYYSFVLL